MVFLHSNQNPEIINMSDIQEMRYGWPKLVTQRIPWVGLLPSWSSEQNYIPYDAIRELQTLATNTKIPNLNNSWSIWTPPASENWYLSHGLKYGLWDNPLSGSSYAVSSKHGFLALENREEALVRVSPVLLSLTSPYLPTDMNGTFRIITRHLLTTIFPMDLQMVFTHSTDMDRFTLQSSAVTFGEDGNQHSTALRRKGSFTWGMIYLLKALGWLGEQRTAPYKASAVLGAEVWGTTPASGWRSFAGTHGCPVLLPWGKRPYVIVVSQSLGAANGLAPVSVHTDND